MSTKMYVLRNLRTGQEVPVTEASYKNIMDPKRVPNWSSRFELVNTLLMEDGPVKISFAPRLETKRQGAPPDLMAMLDNPFAQDTQPDAKETANKRTPKGGKA